MINKDAKGLFFTVGASIGKASAPILLFSSKISNLHSLFSHFHGKSIVIFSTSLAEKHHVARVSLPLAMDRSQFFMLTPKCLFSKEIIIREFS